MRLPIVTGTTFTAGAPPLPLIIPAMRLSITMQGCGISGLRPRCVWTVIHGAWSRATLTSSADTCHLARSVVLRVCVARVSVIDKSVTSGRRHCLPYHDRPL